MAGASRKGSWPRKRSRTCIWCELLAIRTCKILCSRESKRRRQIVKFSALKSPGLIRAGSRQFAANLSLESAGSANDFAGQPARIGRSQEHGYRSDVFWLAEAAQRGPRYHLLLKVAADDSYAVCAFGLNAPGIDGIDADLAWTQLFRQHAGDRVHGAFGRRIDHRRRRRSVT